MPLLFAVVPVGQVDVALCFWQSSLAIVLWSVVWSVGRRSPTSASFTGLQSAMAPSAHPQGSLRQQVKPEQPLSQMLSAPSMTGVAALALMTLLMVSAV